MKRATGVVIKIYAKYVCVRTVNGEFINLTLKDYTPNVGDIYTGTIYSGTALKRVKAIILISVVLLILFGQNLYFYLIPSATIVVNIPPSIQLKVNKWDRIISVKGLQSSGKNLTDSIKLKNKSLDEGLKLIIETAKSEDVINKKYIANDNSVTIYVCCDENKNIDLIKFDEFMKHESLKYQVNNNGKGTFTN